MGLTPKIMMTNLLDVHVQPFSVLHTLFQPGITETLVSSKNAI